MGRRMNRGKQQILFNYLPGCTFDFEGGTIAQVANIRGIPNYDLNIDILLRRIAEEVQAWPENYRPVLRDDIVGNPSRNLSGNPSRFVLLEPKNLDAKLFPKIFWCQNRSCARIYDHSNHDHLPREICRSCGRGKLVQLRFVKTHRCGHLEPLSPPACQQCRTSSHMALDDRGSERIREFRWICRQCGKKLKVFSGLCRCQQWSGDNDMQKMDIQVHRAGSTFYAHTTTLLNIPDSELNRFLSLPQQEWSAVSAAKFFGMPEAARPLSEFADSAGSTNNQPSFTLSIAEEQQLRNRGFSDEQIRQFLQMQAQLQSVRGQVQQNSSPSSITKTLEERTGVPQTTWRQVGLEMLEAVKLLENRQTRDLFSLTQNTTRIHTAQQVAQHIGLSRLALVPDFPVIVATYGYSRVEFAPRRNSSDSVQCRLNPFPPQQDHDSKFPIYVDQVQADALLLSLNPERVHIWLEHNGFQPSNIPNGNNPNLSRRAYFVQLFEDAPLRQTLDITRPQARMVFGLLHTLSHLCVRQAALLCGLDRTSLSEYLLPRTLTFAIYCNHRFGAAIGALTALFEQSLTEWLNAVRDARRCVYDPVCREREASCHACTHLAETSCRFFNLNLGRSFLFGGSDPQLGNIKIGYFDPSLTQAN